MTTMSHPTRIVEAIHNGDVDKARALFREALVGISVSDLVMSLAEAVEPGSGVITVGEGALLYGNPLRVGFAWRCGQCLHRFRSGGPDPKSGVNYKTLRGASNAAHKHSAEDHADLVAVEEVTR